MLLHLPPCVPLPMIILYFQLSVKAYLKYGQRSSRVVDKEYRRLLESYSGTGQTLSWSYNGLKSGCLYSETRDKGEIIRKSMVSRWQHTTGRKVEAIKIEEGAI